MDLFAIAGRHPALSLAEFKAVYPLSEIVNSGSEGWVFRSDKKIDWNRLGGVIKGGEVHTHVPGISGEALHEESIGALVLEQVGAHERLRFGVSVYDASAGLVRVKKARLNIRRGGMQVKEWLQAKGRRPRFVTSREETLSSVVVSKQKLLGADGVEVCVLLALEGTFMGSTSWVQDFEQWSERDYGRPARDAREGMLPPKLARIMVNLAGAPAGDFIFDPFCGSGTVLMEAHLLGYQIGGSDISREAVARAKKNLDWIGADAQVEVSDVRTSGAIARTSIDAIVTEPVLGPPRTGKESSAQLEQTARELRELYADAFQEFAKIVKSRGSVVFVFPIFQKGRQSVRIFSDSLYRYIRKAGFERQTIAHQESWIYRRPDQLVSREIFVFKKK